MISEKFHLRLLIAGRRIRVNPPKVAFLMDMLCEYFDKWVMVDLQEADPGNSITHCNGLVEDVCAAFGYAGFKGDTANKIAAKLAADIEAWLHVDAIVAQSHANAGALAVAAWANPAGGHGHVACLRPGNAAISSKWGKKAPKCFNIGKRNLVGAAANWCFADEPGYYVLKRSID